MTKTVLYVVQVASRVEGFWLDYLNGVEAVEEAQEIIGLAREEGCLPRLIRRTIIEEVLE